MIIDSQCKKCRRAGQKLFLKGERCYGQKCAMVRRPYPPGVHGKARRRFSEFAQQLSEKQKVKRVYGISEKQFSNYFKEVLRQKGDKEELLVQKLERRLDNAVFRLGWADSRRMARQIVNHGHILVNGRKLDIPSYQVKEKDVIKLKQRSGKLALFQDLKTKLKKQEIPAWLDLDKQKIEAVVKGYPSKDNFDKVGELNRIIEFYSR